MLVWIHVCIRAAGMERNVDSQDAKYRYLNNNDAMIAIIEAREQANR